ncbi:MAG TPA: GNAT family N-acetyltransferase [Actinomycetes bacterium]|nr:GNAT family N-acetyltransferase [Actinomycetes bacterium]
MRSTEVVPFTAEHLEAAADLLSQRHRTQRRAVPLLSPSYEDPKVTQPLLASLLEGDSASGAVAVHRGRVAAYVLGSPKADSWGPNMWVEGAGMASSEAELIRDAYAVAAQRWHDEGRTSHFVIVPSCDDAMLDAWYRLGFGQQHAHAIQPPREAVLTDSSVVVRRAEHRDIDMLAELDLALPKHQSRSPVFSNSGIPPIEEAREEWLESIDDKRFANFVAEYNGRVVGSAIGCSLEVSSSHQHVTRPDNAGFLGFAAVLPESRGVGTGRALGETVIGWSRDEGFNSVVTDWRVTNLLSSRAWPSLGFETTFLRLARTIGPAG